jgi:hypothetical protein
MRVAMKLNIEAFCVNHHFVYRLTTKKPLVWGNFDEYPKIFKKLPSRIKKRGLLIAKAQLQNRFIGKKDILYQLSSPMKGETFSKKKKFGKRVLKSNNNFKILIAAHDFNDAPHLHQDLIFEDMYEWLNYLGRKSLVKKNFDWYIKLHPDEFDDNYKKIKFFLDRYNKFKLLPKNVSHNQIVHEGINCALTCYGSIGHEYPFFKIPVINAGHNPHFGYNFNFNPENKKQYNILINNLKSLRASKNFENQIYQFYLVRFFLDYNLFPDVKNENQFDDIKIFQKFFKKYKKKHITKIMEDYYNFINSDKRRLINTDQIN